MEPIHFFLLFLGFGTGLIGTLVGAGGGFLAVPVLVLGLKIPPALAAGTSLVMVGVNGIVGTFSHARRGKVDFRGGFWIALAAYPGSILGTWLAARTSPKDFHLAFGLVLVGVATWLGVRTLWGMPAPRKVNQDNAGFLTYVRQVPLPKGLSGEEGDKTYGVTTYLPLFVAVCFVVGTLGALMGIGGGPMLTPFLVLAMGYPIHLATATVQVNIALTSLLAAVLYALRGQVIVDYALAMTLGTVVGSPVGAWISTKVNPRILTLLTVTLLFGLGVRLVVPQILSLL